MPERSLPEWHPDPFGRHEMRYWDGRQWTHHVSSGGRAGVDPPVSSAQPTVRAPANWYPDPYGRHESRYWDGDRWTHHVSSRGRQQVDLLGDRGAADHHARGVPEWNHPLDHPNARWAEPALLTAPVLVVNQKARLLGSNVEYAVRDQNGRQIGAVQEVGRGLWKKAKDKHRRRTEASRTYRLHVVDPAGRVLIAMTRPRKWLRSKMIVMDGNGNQIGQIAQETFGVAGSAATIAHAGLAGWSKRFDAATEGIYKAGYVRFRIESGDQLLGSIHGDNLEAWDFNIRDAADMEIARITKTWAGWKKERFTKADNYVVEIYRPLTEPLRSLVIAAALAVDIALKQGHPTSGSGAYRKYH